MDKDLLIFNITSVCKIRGEPYTKACVGAGVGKDFIGDIRRGKVPSVAKVAQLAAYLGVSTSDLVGDARASPSEAELIRLFRSMNQEGQERLLDHADDMVRGGKYIKSGSSQLDQKEDIG